MKYPFIESTFFIQNRNRFIKHLKPNSVAVFNSNDEFPRNGDQNFPFRQNSDLFYLSGIDQEKTILLLAPDCPIEAYREVLFTLETNDYLATWYGEKLSQQEVANISGVKTAFWLESFEEVFSDVLKTIDTIYLNSNENSRFSTEVPYLDLRFAADLKIKYSHFNFEKSAPIMSFLRTIKSPVEIELIRKACQITEKTFHRLLKFVKPGVMEYEIEAEIIHEFIRNSANGHSFHPIVASGKNATYLHYEKNNQQCSDGDLVLLDFGAEYANYPADLSRTIPVNGKFSKRQKECYNAVLRIMKQARQMLVIGTTIEKYHAEVCKLMEVEMIRLGLFSETDVKNQNPEKPLYLKYYMHGTSHFIGLDVHDLGSKQEPLKAGMVFSCEPGLYIKDEGIGIRIEDDILITEKGPVDLLENVPVEADEIEEIMNMSK